MVSRVTARTLRRAEHTCHAPSAAQEGAIDTLRVRCDNPGVIERDSNRARAAHLLRRTSLIVDPERIDELASMSREAAVASVLNDTADIATPPADLDFEGVVPWWVAEMVRPGSGLAEKMAWYWHTILPTHLAKITYQPLVAAQMQKFRTSSLANLGSILHQFVNDGALMQYLDASGSRPPTPNENLARELMELFTIGPGNYTENDVRSAALALTGWQVNLATGAISFDAANAFRGQVEFLGQLRSWDPTSIVDRLLAHPGTAQRHAGLLYEHLVGLPLPASEAAELGSWWSSQGLELRALIERILLSDAFDNSRLVRPRGPLEFYCAVRSIVGFGESELWRLLALGQAPYRPPNVGGWPDGAAWLTPAGLLPRTQMVANIDVASPTGDLATVDGILDRCGMHEVSESTMEALTAVEDDSSLTNDDELRQARLRLALVSPEFQVS